MHAIYITVCACLCVCLILEIQIDFGLYGLFASRNNCIISISKDLRQREQEDS